MDIIGLGTVAMDVILQVDSLPKEDGFAVVTGKSYRDGGSAANVLVQAGRLGAQCGFIAQVGDDEIGGEIIKGLQKEGIDTRYMPVKKAGTSLYTTIVVGESGKKFILLTMGDAFLAMDSGSLDLDYIKSGKIFYTDLLPGEPALYALREAKKAGLKTVFNLQVSVSMMEQFGIKRQDILEALQYVDVFAPCREAFSQLTEVENHTVGMERFKQVYNGLLLLTLGSEGSAASFGDTVVRIPVHPVEVKDTTGAGDSYLGAFMVAYLVRRQALEAAMKFSSVCAAVTCTGLGARSGPALSDMEKMMNIG